MSAKTTESKASRQDHPSEPAPDIDNNLYDDSESQKKDYSNADFVPLIIVVFLIMISNSPCKKYTFLSNAASFAEIICLILRKFAENSHEKDRKRHHARTPDAFR